MATLLLLLPACLHAQRVEGRVIDAITGRGLSGVNVFLLRGTQTTDYWTSTDSTGHFAIEAVKSGAYSALYTVGGYIQREPNLRPVFTVPEAGSPVILEGRLWPRPHLSGRVVNHEDEGIQGASVSLTTSRISIQFPSDSNGKFDVDYDAVAESFILSVSPPHGLKPPPPDKETGEAMAWARTFYPGVTRSDAASKLSVAAGSDLSGIKLEILPAPAHAIRGQVFNPDGTPARRAKIRLADTYALPSQEVESKGDGSFEFPAVVDGEWCLLAGVAANNSVYLEGKQWLEMVGHDENVKLRLERPFNVPVKMVFERPDGVPEPTRLPTVSLDAYPRQPHLPPGVFSSPQPSHSDGNGGLVVEKAYPGAFRILTSPPPPGFYLDTILMGGQPAVGDDVLISSGAVPITVVFKMNGGSVRGTVEKCGRGLVWLMPVEPELQRVGFVRSAVCNADGHYAVDTLRPGDYYALAFADRAQMPAYESSLNQATRVTVRAGESTWQDLRALVRPMY